MLAVFKPRRRLWFSAGIVAGIAFSASSQTLLPLSQITPGTEIVQLVTNGDFQSRGTLVAGKYPSPTGWNRVGNVFVGDGTNTVAADGGVVALGDVSTAAPVGQYSRAQTLEPATDYVFSAYLWNFGNAANRVTTVVDLNDASGEPQIILNYTDVSADRGYFCFRYFNTATTGTNVIVRAFYDTLTGTGASPTYFPIGAQWDNIAITKAAVFRRPETNRLVSLKIQKTNANVLLSWPLLGTNMAAQSASNIGAQVVWKNVTNAVVVGSSSNLVTLPSASGQNYFRLVDAVDSTTLTKKVMMGYQGWFACPGDGSLPNRWVHWFRNNSPVVANLNVDFWPDVSELDADELFATSLTYSNGSAAKLFSSFNAKTVRRHFKWMRDSQLDGVFLQRFTSELSDPAFFALRNQVASNVWSGAEAYGRVFAMMYDISGQPAATITNTIQSDWNYLVNTMKLTSSPRYLRHKGKPVVAVWGFGFSGRPDTPQDCTNVINQLKSTGAIVMGGLPTNWRTLNGDSQTNAAWASAFRSFDIISPWSVGRYSTEAQANNFKSNATVPDLANATSLGLDYMPVIWPGFSWYNLNGGPLNQIPRNGGNFFWRQAYNATSAGCKMIYVAMFDEVDEGTAIFKVAANASQLPAQGSFVPLNIDGYTLPNDWYLRLTGAATKMLRGDIPLQSTMPASP
ncbi:MAG: hypothetical protein EXS35_09640 [Pedosphaera sp.]|nr:hypothetical protein [Pedosphaera sp.]